MSEMGLRQRVLTLPVMTAIVLSMVWRQIPSLSELLRVVEREGMFDFSAIKLTKQAVSQRLQRLPAKLFAQVFTGAIEELQRQECVEVQLSEPLQAIREKFPLCFVADGSTLEALRNKLKDKEQQQGSPKAKAATALGGRMMGILDIYTRRVVRAWYCEDAACRCQDFLLCR